MHITILGAGIVGLAAAWELTERGHRVTIVDRGTVGAGASSGNGAQLSYSYVQPLADPAIWKQLPKLLLARESPLKVRAQLDPHQWRWGLAFLAACTAGTSRNTTTQLLALAERSRIGFEAMRAQLEPDCDFSETGKLVIHRSQAALDAAARQVELQHTLGSAPQRIVTADECVAIEPALADVRQQLAGAVYTPSECAADCFKVCLAMEAALKQRGVQFLLGNEVSGFKLQGGKITALRTGRGPIEGETFIMALGIGSEALARKLGLRLPVYPLKGYSITLDVDSTRHAAPTVSVTDAAHKVVFARLGHRLRVAGMAELVGYDTSIPTPRIALLMASTQALFPHFSPAREGHPWTGMRPATPTGRPIIGRVDGAPANLWFDTGHGALGFTLAFGSAAHIADLIEAQEATPA